MAKKQSKSARIRKLLEQGKSIKQIAATVQCTPQLVYQARADMKKKELIQTGKTVQRWKKEQDDAFNAASIKPGAIRYGVDKVLVPKDYFQPKPTLWERFKSFIGA